MRGATTNSVFNDAKARISIHAPHARGDGRAQEARRPRQISIHAPHARGDLAARQAVKERARFQSTPLMRGATVVIGTRDIVRTISIHAPHARGDVIGQIHVTPTVISIHAPHARGDRPLPGSHRRCRNFNPRPSCEGRPTRTEAGSCFLLFQSTPLMRGATEAHRLRVAGRKISIHAPHARGDNSLFGAWRKAAHFNPRPSCEGRRPRASPLGTRSPNFNPRPSCEGRLFVTGGGFGILYFNPRPSCEGRPSWRRRRANNVIISIHAPHARGDWQTSPPRLTRWYFNPRPSCEGRPRTSRGAPRGGDFNPRPSCEGRRPHEGRREYAPKFQSTPLMRGATQGEGACVAELAFQSTPLMRGATSGEVVTIRTRRFQSTPLMRGATSRAAPCAPLRGFQSTPLMRGATSAWVIAVSLILFQSTPLMRGATCSCRTCRRHTAHFNPRPSCEGRRLREAPHG